MITAAIVLAYLTANLYAARHIYSRLRARAIDKRATQNAELHFVRTDAVKEFNEWDRAEIVVGAILATLFWPLVVVGFGVYRFVTTGPALSQTELARDRKAMERRIRELEHELGIAAKGAS